MRSIYLSALSMLLVVTISAAADPTIFGDLPATVTAGPGTWVKLPNGPNAGGAQRHDDVFFVDPEQGWVVNGNGDVWKTADGGDSWTRSALTGAYNRCVGFVDAQHGWIGFLYEDLGAVLIETTNGGSTWTTVNLPEPKPEGLCGMSVVDANTVCAVGAYYGAPRFIRTDDAGASWTVLDMTPWCSALIDTKWFDEQTGIAVGATGNGPTRQTRILRTTDGGLTWNVVWTGTRYREHCWKISFPDWDNGFVSIENLAGAGATYFLKSIDGGRSWQEQLAAPGYVNCQGIGFLNESIGWIGGWNTGTAVTTNGGANWTGGNFGFNVNRIQFLSPYLGYACGADVYKYEANPSGVLDPPTTAEAPRLSRVSPNPFSGSTVIGYHVTEPGRVSLRVFDLQGRPVGDLVEATMGIGEFTATFNAQGLSAGTYFYELRTPAGAETGKIKLTR
ncbi:MAG: YCF48-related protein [Candidatus Eisenbacteria bacterium]|nr:YCF48-related protein [Candidatus Eisenbacteria bacterium]